MKITRVTIAVLVKLALAAAILPVGAQEPTANEQRPLLKRAGKTSVNHHPCPVASGKRSLGCRRQTVRPVIPPVTVLNNPEYLSGEASINVAANSNPLIRIGIAQNGVTLIEFPASDKFFAVHAGNSDLVTVEKSPTLRRDHHLVLRAGSGFLAPNERAKRPLTVTPATSIIAQMDSGMAITLMIYPVPLLKQQAHRLVIKYNLDEVLAARRAAGLAINLVGPEASPPQIAADKLIHPAADSPVVPPPDSQASTISTALWRDGEVATKPKADYKQAVQDALSEAIKNPKWFKKWAEQRHGLRVSTLPPRDLSDSARLVVFAVHNAGGQSVRLVPGYPDLYVETLNEQSRPVEAGTKIEKFNLASSPSDNLLPAGATRYFAIAYDAPILGAQQHLKIVVAHSNAADEPAMADLTALSR
jgi:hypothetical protein